MKRFTASLHYVMFALFITVLVLPGCSGGGDDTSKKIVTDPNDPNPGGTDPSAAEARVSEAKTALSNQDIAIAKAKFQAALAADPNNKDANFGFAITEAIMLIEDPDVVAIINRWDANAPTVRDAVYGAMKKSPAFRAKALAGASLSTSEGPDPLTQAKALLEKLPKNKQPLLQRTKRAFAAALPANAPTVSEMQAVLDNKVIPLLTDVIAKLRVIEGTGFTFTITPAMTGGSETVNTVLDDGEFYAMDAALSALKSILNVLLAYNLDFDYNSAEYDPLSVLYGPSGGSPTTISASFFTLKSNGAAKMTAALTGLREAADKAKLCYTFVYDQWGYTGATNLTPTKNPNDNGLQWHNEGCPSCFTRTDDTETRNGFDAVKMALEGQVTYTETVANGTGTETLSNGVTTITLWTGQEYGPNSTETFVFDATKFFASPLDRTDLPPFSYDPAIDIALSQEYGEPVNSVVNGTPIYSEIVDGDVPDDTLNGIFPNGMPQ